MTDKKKSKAKNLTDAICRSLPRLDKRYMKQGDYPGLELWVQPGGSKGWYYQYRIKGVKDPLRKKIGSFPTVGVTEAFNREKQLAMNLGEIYLVTENGNERLGKQKLDLVVL